MENAKQKAIELVEKYKGLVYPYLGSGMLTNTEEPSVVLSNAKKSALIAVDEIISTCPQKENEIFGISKGIKYWQEVKQEIESL